MIAVGVIATLSALLAGCATAHAKSAANHTATSSTTAPDTSSTTLTTAVAPPTSTTSSTAPADAGGTLPSGQPLAGKLVGIDPGHNGLNYTEPSFLNRQINNGRSSEDCDTTGTETAGGYTEALFNWNVAQFLMTDLQTEGAKVVVTRSSNSGVGPCVDQRAQIINDAHANVAIDIHADGGPVSGRGFAVLEPVADGPNNSIIDSSVAFGSDVRTAFLAATGMPVSTYDGTNGLVFRDDLAGLNLTTVPKVLIECGNMQNSTDAALLSTPAFQEKVAQALAIAITNFLR